MKNTSMNNSTKDRDFVTILGIKIHSTPKEEVLKSIQNKISKKIQFYIVTPNPEIIIQAQSDPELAHSLNSATFSLPDGFGLRFADKSLRIIKGRQFLVDILNLANSKKLKVYILGSTPSVNKSAIEKVKKEFPNIEVKGSSGPRLDIKANPVSEVDITKQFEIVKQINTFKPSLLVLGFGTPKQELWIQKHLTGLNVIGAVGLGGAIDYYAEAVRKVPSLFVKLNLEWLWRLIQEPRRIKRIFNALIVFPLKLAIDKVFTVKE